MKTPVIGTVAISLVLATLACCSPAPDATTPSVRHEPLVVFLVRHGEKVDLSDDAELSIAGRERAALLARTLRSAEIEYVHSTDFIRTRSTAAPAAAELGELVQIYDHRELSALARQMRATGGRHLVVGHSTTTHQMVELLGGDAGAPIDDDGEYDRLYVVTIGADGAVSTVLLRYGVPFTPGARP